VEVFLQSGDAQAIAALQRHGQSLTILAKVKELTFNAESGPPAAAAKSVVDAVEIFLPLAGIIDFSEEDKRLTKEIDKLSKDLSGAQRKLTNEDFLAKAPAEVVAKEKDKVQGWTEKLTKLKNHWERIKELMG
jgi:valyl-tRNA synthetase